MVNQKKYQKKVKKIIITELGLYLSKELTSENYWEISYEIKEEKINFILKFNLNKT